MSLICLAMLIVDQVSDDKYDAVQHWILKYPTDYLSASFSVN